MMESVVWVRKSHYEEFLVIFKILQIKARATHFLTDIDINSTEHILLTFIKGHFSLEGNLLTIEKNSSFDFISQDFKAQFYL